MSICQLAGPRKGTFTACIAQARPNNLTSAAQAAGHPFHIVTTAWRNTLLVRLWPARYTDNRHPYSDGHPMSTKASIKYHHGEAGEPSWHLYAEAFEKDDVVYLELEGVLADVVMIDSAWTKAGTVVLRLPTTTAKQLGLLPPGDPANTCYQSIHP